MQRLIAQKLIISGQPIEGPIVNPITKKPIENISEIVSIIMNFLFPIAGILLFIYLVMGGFSILTSQGDVEKVKSGKMKITYAIIGYVLLIFSLLFVRLIGYITGLS